MHFICFAFLNSSSRSKILRLKRTYSNFVIPDILNCNLNSYCNSFCFQTGFPDLKREVERKWCYYETVTDIKIFKMTNFALIVMPLVSKPQSGN